jgi:hypothetical protein
MNTTKSLLIAAAVTGALSALPLSARAESTSPSTRPTADKQGCNGQGGQDGADKDKDKNKDKDKDKDSCKGKAKQGKDKPKDKSACSGKDGCGGKDK